MKKLLIVFTMLILAGGANATVEELIFKPVQNLTVTKNNQITFSYELKCNEYLSEVIRKDFKAGDKIQINLGVLVNANNLLDCVGSTMVSAKAGNTYSGFDFELVSIQK